MKETIQDVLQLILQADDIKYVKNSGILNYGLDLKRKRLIFRYVRKIPDYFSVAGAP